MQTNLEVIKSFFRGNFAKSGSMTTDGCKLFSYATVIAEHSGSDVIVNRTKYSVTTSKQQTYLRREIDRRGVSVKYVDDVELGARSLQ